jgi:hypothetical protein
LREREREIETGKTEKSVMSESHSVGKVSNIICKFKKCEKFNIIVIKLKKCAKIRKHFGGFV